eukprot:SAG25_NODE_13008_length_272_cov_1.138728_1_plen_25_part_10
MAMMMTLMITDGGAVLPAASPSIQR